MRAKTISTKKMSRKNEKMPSLKNKAKNRSRLRTHQQITNPTVGFQHRGCGSCAETTSTHHTRCDVDLFRVTRHGLCRGHEEFGEIVGRLARQCAPQVQTWLRVEWQNIGYSHGRQTRR